MAIRRSLVLMTVLLQGCAVALVPPAAPRGNAAAKAPADAAAPAEPGATAARPADGAAKAPDAGANPDAGATPVDAAKPAATPPKPADATTPAVAPGKLALPARVLPALPPTLESRGGGTDPLAIMLPSQLVGNNGNTYRVAQAPPPPNVMDPCAIAGMFRRISRGTGVLQSDMAVLGFGLGRLGQILAAAGDVTPGKLKTIVIDGKHDGPIQETLLLELAAGGGRLFVSDSAEFRKDRTWSVVDFKSATQGRALLRVNDPKYRLGAIIDFDLGARTATVDVIAQPKSDAEALKAAPALAKLGRMRVGQRWTLKELAEGPVAFEFRSTYTRVMADLPCFSLKQALAANFLRDGSAALRVGVLAPDATAMAFDAPDGSEVAEADASSDLFLGPTGADVGADLATEAQRAARPGKDALPPLLQLGIEGDPLSAPPYALPDPAAAPSS